MKRTVKFGLAVVAGLMGVLSLSANADVFKRDELIVSQKENAGGGEGILHRAFSFTRDQALPEQAIKEIGWLTLEPGASIGYHRHESNEDTYIIVSGEGVFTDKDGVDYPVSAGDITIVRAGESHGLRNTGTEPLVFVDVIAEQ